MASNLDMDLDDIIKQERKTKSTRTKTNGRSAKTKKGGKAEPTTVTVDKLTSPKRTSRTKRTGGASGKVGKTSINSRLGLSTRVAQAVISSAGGAREHTVKITNLDPAASAEDLRTSFKKFGHIVKCSLVYARNGQPSGDAEITYEKWGSANAAINAMDGITADGRKLSVRLVTPAPVASTPAPTTRTSTRRTIASKSSSSRSSSGQNKKEPTTFRLIL